MSGDIRTIFLEELGNIAPEADLDALDPKADLREELDIDSMDFLNLITAIHNRLGVNVPEIDYAKLTTLAGAIGYLEKHLPSSSTPKQGA
jgi:acyl carrier protein